MVLTLIMNYMKYILINKDNRIAGVVILRYNWIKHNYGGAFAPAIGSVVVWII